jgi:dTDP-4-amino-4,6-dideoxygalactose transaminase
LVFGQPRLEQEEIDEVVDTLRSGWLGTGPKTATFESEFAAYCETPCAVAVSSCTAALHLSLLTIGAGPGTGVVTSPLTFASTANAVFHRGAELLLVDIDVDTLNLSPVRLRAFLEKDCESIAGKRRRRHRRTGVEIIAVLPVHFAGRPCEMDEIEKLAGEFDLRIIEDAAHAIEARYHGRKIGHIADLTCFSFYATKNLTTGEGGMITLSDPAVAERLRTAARHGLSLDAWGRYSKRDTAHYEVLVPGYKYNMTDIAASIGLHQLHRLEANLSRRAAIWARYDRELADLPITLPTASAPATRHARHLDRKRTGVDRDELRRRLHAHNIGSGVHFVSIHLHDFYRRHLGLAPADLPAALYVSERTVSLPLSAHLGDGDVGDVIEAVRDALVRR